MIEKDGEVHSCQKHQLPVLMVDCDKKLKRNQRLLCTECMENLESKAKLMSFKKAFHDIQENQKKIKQSIENVIMINIDQIESLQKDCVLLKSNVIQQLDQLIRNVDEWIKNVLIIGEQNAAYSFYDELDNLIDQTKLDEFNQKSFIDQINDINQQRNQKITNQINLFKSFKEGQKCEEILRKLENINSIIENVRQQIFIEGNEEANMQQQNEVIQVQNEQKQFEQQWLMIDKQVEFKLIDDSNQQSSQCYAIVFNQDGSIMISSCIKEIKI